MQSIEEHQHLCLSINLFITFFTVGPLLCLFCGLLSQVSRVYNIEGNAIPLVFVKEYLFFFLFPQPKRGIIIICGR